MRYQVREYEPDDIEGVVSAWKNASKLAHPFLTDAFMITEEKNMRELYMPNARSWVITHADDVIGFISLPVDENEVGAIFVQPDFHGTGAGRALMDLAKRQHATLYVEVFEANTIGRAFYEKCGFQLESKYFHEESQQPMLRLRFEG